MSAHRPYWQIESSEENGDLMFWSPVGNEKRSKWGMPVAKFVDRTNQPPRVYTRWEKFQQRWLV